MSSRDLSIYIGNQIKKYRKINGWTQTQLADKLKIKKAAVSKYENGHRVPKDDILFELAHLFNIKLDDLFPPRDTQTLNSNDGPQPKRAAVFKLAKRITLHKTPEWEELSENLMKITNEEVVKVNSYVKFMLAEREENDPPI